jgi:hypothetical protein
MFSTLCSATFGFVDLIAHSVVRCTSPILPYFRAGWGDVHSSLVASEHMVQVALTGQPVAVSPATISWTPYALLANASHALAYEGTFLSPSSLLPSHVDQCRFLLLLPRDAGSEWRPWDDPATCDESAGGVSSSSDGGCAPLDVVFLLPATGEESYDTRVALGERLLSEGRRVGIFIITAPFYGLRKDPLLLLRGGSGGGSNGDGDSTGVSRAASSAACVLAEPGVFAPDTVAAFCAQCLAIIAETGAAEAEMGWGRAHPGVNPQRRSCLSGTPKPGTCCPHTYTPTCMPPSPPPPSSPFIAPLPQCPLPPGRTPALQPAHSVSLASHGERRWQRRLPSGASLRYLRAHLAVSSQPCPTSAHPPPRSLSTA